MTMITNLRGPWPKNIDRWQLIRFGLLSVCLSLAVVVVFFSLLAPLDWLLRLLNIQLQIVSIVFSTLIILLIFSSFYRWMCGLVDAIFFPDTVGFREKIAIACQTLTEIDTSAMLDHYLTYELPQKLEVESITVSKAEQPDAPAGGLALPLQMGGQSLGVLVVGPKSSGRLLTREEQSAFRLLQEQMSRVVSVLQLADAREQAEKADRQKSNFLTNISNELRTPLNAVINLTGLVLDEAVGPIIPEHKGYLSQAVNGSEYLMNLLDDILDITKIETGELTLHFGMLEFSDVINDALPLVRGMLQDKPIELRLEIEDDIPPLMADRLRVRQILLNLLSNAVKFTKEGFISIKAHSDKDWVYITVKDTGIGIAKEDLSLIFQDYQQILMRSNQGVGKERRRHLGTGLGMPITQALVTLHGGQINIESELGQGATFTFTLPHLFSTSKLELTK